MSVWFNGRPVSSVEWAGTRALQYGDGVFRTLLVLDGRIVDETGQRNHLLDDAGRLGMTLDDADAAWEIARTAVTGTSRGTLRITLSRRASGRGYAPGSDRCDVLLQVGELPAHPRERWTEGVVLGWSPVLLGLQPRLAGIKHCNRLEQVLASRDWPAGQHEALMCDAEGRLISGTRSNVFFVIDGIPVTPALRGSGVTGRMRARLIELSEAAGHGIEIGTVSPDEVRHASEAFVSNSLIGIWPVRRIGGLDLQSPGPLTQRLMQALGHPWSGA